MTSIESFVADVSSRLHIGRRERARIVQEVRDHLDDAVSARVGLDVDEQQAVDLALGAFGSPEAFARDFNVQAGTRAMRKAPLIALGGGVAVAAGFLLAVTRQPRASVLHPASVITELTFFAAALALQVALVAGICAASRVIALARVPEAPAADRQYVRGCSMISVAALSASALAWVVTVDLALSAQSIRNELSLGVGAGLMAMGAVLAAVLIVRLDVNPRADAREPTSGPGSILGIGERLIGFVRRHPVVSCSAVAVPAALSAMAHAETTAAAALPWGVSEAVAVVLGFVLLGPSLGLRPRRVT